jgi:hypothetical protein
MNKILYSILAMALLVTSCSPIESDETLGGVLPVNEVKGTVKNYKPGSNILILENETPGTAVFWDYIGGVLSLRQSDTLAIPFVGTLMIRQTLLCDGGQVTKEIPVTIVRTKNDPEDDAKYPINPMWGLLAGTTVDGKTWIWSDNTSWAGPYGKGGYGTSPWPDWSGIENISKLPEHNGISPDQEMKFDLVGKPNFTKRTLSGEVLEEGLFSWILYSKPQPTVPDMGYPWAIGQLTLKGATVLSGFGYDDTKGTTPIYTYDIVKLTDTEMVLAWAANGTKFGDWLESATMWCFKKK